MSEEKMLIERFYAAFQQRDFKTMAGCYHPDASFKDEAFQLKGSEIGSMWQMLCERGTDLELEYSVSELSGVVSAHWEPRYTFGQTGRKVHNIVDAEFTFKDGKIINHIDRFDFWRWSRQALGAPGFLMGWSSFLQNKVGTMANKSLKSFIKKQSVK